MIRQLRVLSLFDGISCGQVALERAGIPVEVYYASEIDEHAIQVTQKNYPNTIQLGDVTKIDFADEKFSDIDLIIGGSPCQDLSIAKTNRQGLQGTRSGLFFKYVEALRTIKPKYFLLENNNSMSQENKDKITEILGVKPVLINSSDFSAQIRERLYWTNIPIQKIVNKNTQTIKDILDTHSNRKKYSFEKHILTIKVNDDNTIVKWDTSGKGYYSQQSRARSLNVKMNTIPASGTDKNNIWLGGSEYFKITPLEAERLQTLTDNYTDCISSKSKRISVCGNGWTVDVIAHIFSFLRKAE